VPVENRARTAFERRDLTMNKTDEYALTVDRDTKTLRELALEKMRAAILDLRFRPGERLIERTLCERLGVSRTVVREVLRHLETEGFVETIPHHGPAVARLDLASALQIYDLRALLEADAAGAFALTATPEQLDGLKNAMQSIETAFQNQIPHLVLKATTRFYEVMFTSAGKTVAWEIVQRLNARITHLRALTISTPNRQENSIAEMHRILQAIGDHDGPAASAASIDHVRTVASLARKALTANQE
jgi:DNA-binding GntR family transcriptional regulator